MKLSARQIADFLKKPEQVSGALIYGPDEGLVRERVKAITKQILGEKPDDFAIVEIDEISLKENPTRLFEEAAAMSFLIQKKVIILRAPPDKIYSDIESIIPNLDKATYIIVSEGELTPKSAMRQLFEQHQQLASLACYKDEAANLSQLVRDTLNRHSLNIRPDALIAMTQRLGNDRGVTTSEIEKLAIYKLGEQEVTLDDINAMIAENQENEAIEAAYTLLEGNAGEFDHKLASLLREGVQVVAILRSIQRHLQRLHFASGLIQQGNGVDEAIKSLRPPVFFKEEPRFRQQLRALPINALSRLLSRVMEIEAKLKTGANSPELAIAELTMLFSKLKKVV